jgi:hypothetical protein
MRTTATSLAAAMLFLSLCAGSAAAQYQGPEGIPPHKGEIGFHGGYVWTWAREVYVGSVTTGSMDIKESGYWGITLDVNVEPGKQVELLYRRQDSRLTFRTPLTPAVDLVDVGVEYWQIGGLGGVPRGDFLPYGLFTVGATHVMFKNSPYEDNWKFSMMFGLGAKKYMGEKFGLRAQAQLPFTIIDGGGTISCGSLGCISTIGGTGVGQIDIGGGLFLQF